MSVILLSGCASSVYVGDVRFEFAEVCSKEYAPDESVSRRVTNTWGLGCVPPARSHHATSFYFSKLRPLLSRGERDALDALRSSTSREGGGTSNSNPLPGWLGRVFEAALGETPGSVEFVDRSGNLTFPPIDSEYVSSLGAEMRVVADLRGQDLDERIARAHARVSSAIETALLAFGITKHERLTQRLGDLMLDAGWQTGSLATASATYLYVDLKDAVLDTMLECLRSQGLVAERHPARTPWSGQRTNALCQKSSHEKYARSLKNRPEKAFGLVIGVAILRTKSALNDSCTQINLGVGQSANNLGARTNHCEWLKEEIQRHLGRYRRGSGGPAIELDEFLFRLEGAHEGRRNLEIANHASVLAIQWIPLRRDHDSLDPK